MAAVARVWKLPIRGRQRGLGLGHVDQRPARLPGGLVSEERRREMRVIAAALRDPRRRSPTAQKPP